IAEEDLVLTPEHQPHRPAAAPGAPHQHRADVVEALDVRQVPVRRVDRTRLPERGLKRAPARLERADVPGTGKMNEALAVSGGSDLHARITDRHGCSLLHSRGDAPPDINDDGFPCRNASSKGPGAQRHDSKVIRVRISLPRPGSS